MTSKNHDEDEPGAGEPRPSDAGPLGLLGGLGGLGGLGDLIGEAREHLEQATAQAQDVTVTGRAGGGAVEIVMSGNLEVESVTISKDVVDPEDVSMLEDLVLAAVRDAVTAALDVRDRATSSLMPDTLDIGAMMSGLLGGFGGEPGGGFAGGIEVGGQLPDLGALLGGLFGGDAGPHPVEEAFDDAFEDDFDDEDDGNDDPDFEADFEAAADSTADDSEHPHSPGGTEAH